MILCGSCGPHLGAIWSCGGQHHGLAEHLAHVGRLEVGHYDHPPPLHLLQGDVLHQPAHHLRMQMRSIRLAACAHARRSGKPRQDVITGLLLLPEIAPFAMYSITQVLCVMDW